MAVRRNSALLLLLGTTLRGCLSQETEGNPPLKSSWDAPWEDVAIVKVGGSSITDKAHQETLLESALQWFARTVADHTSDDFRDPPSGTRSCHALQNDASMTCVRRNNSTAFVLVHGAGSFGHHTAKESGLQGYKYRSSSEPSSAQTQNRSASEQRFQMSGLARTRRSVQKLNQWVVQALLDRGVNAVGVSPCFGAITELPAGARSSSVPSLQQTSFVQALQGLVESALRVGLIPVLHGDACLCVDAGRNPRGCILSGDTIMEVLGQAQWASRAIFLTDVDGVYTRDPKTDPSARLLREIAVTPTGDLVLDRDGLDASGSTHAHDVTGGLQTKLSAAARIAAAGKNVTIARCGSPAAEKAFRPHEGRPEHCSVLYPSR